MTNAEIALQLTIKYMDMHGLRFVTKGAESPAEIANIISEIYAGVFKGVVATNAEESKIDPL